MTRHYEATFKLFHLIINISQILVRVGYEMTKVNGYDWLLLKI